jgi:hypothetical protein
MAKTRKCRAPPRRRKQHGGVNIDPPVEDNSHIVDITIPLVVEIVNDNDEDRNEIEQAQILWPNINSIKTYIKTPPLNPYDMMESILQSALTFEGERMFSEILNSKWTNDFSIKVRVRTIEEEYEKIVDYFIIDDLLNIEYLDADDNGWVTHLPGTDIEYARVRMGEKNDFRIREVFDDNVEDFNNNNPNNPPNNQVPPQPPLWDPLPPALAAPAAGGACRRTNKRKSRRVTRKKRRTSRR